MTDPPVVAAIAAWRRAQTSLDEAQALLDDAATDAEMRELAFEEREAARTELEERAREILIALLPKDAADERGVILEIRAGTGGDEAALFAGDLLRMYQRYAASKGWSLDLLSESEGTMGGYKEVIAEISGNRELLRLLSTDLWRHARSYYQRVWDTLGERSRQTHFEHVAILEALRQRDGELAALLMRRHIDRSRRVLRVAHRQGRTAQLHRRIA